MALVLKDRVQETSSTSGTGTLTLSGAIAGYQTFSTAIGNGNTTFYTIYDPTANDWEVGIGTVGAGTLARTTVLSNSAGTTTQISFAGNAKFVFCTYPAEKSINYDANGVATIGEELGYADTGIVGSFTSTVAGYNQVIVQNKSTATNASSNLNVSNDAGTAGSNYAELGINSSTFTGAGSFNIAGASYVASASTDLTLGTYGAYNVHFVTNSNTTDAMTIFNNGGISLGGFANPGIANMAASKFVPGYSAVTSAAGTTVLTASSNYYQNLLGTTTQTFQLPDATTLLVGTTFIFDNDSTGNLTVVDNASGPIDSIPAGGVDYIYLANNSTVAGTWRKHAFIPAAYDFNNTTASFGNAAITNAVWNGTTIGTAYGGTGLTSFSAANYALYSTNSSTLTAGTLPVAAGGSGAVTFTANGVLYGSGTSPLGVTAAGVTGEVLVGNTGGAPSWATLSSSTVSSFSAGTTGFTPNSATTGAVTLAGTLNVANGGTGLTSLTAGLIPYGAGTSAYASSSALQYSVQYSAGANPILYSTNGVATGTGTISFPTTNTGIGYYSRGGTSIGGFAVQDGQGRLNQYWNAYTDSGGVKYTVSGEAAARYLMGVNSTTGATHAWYGAPSGTAGTALTWTQVGQMTSGTGGFTWFSPRGTSSDFYIDINGNVGVGTTSPSVKLDVIGSIKASAAATQDGIILAGRAGGTSSYAVTLTPTTLTASRTVTLPNADINFTTGLPVANGGTGQTTYVNGELLIGNTTGNTLTKATLTQGTGITITNGTGSITVANAGVTSITGTANQITASASTGAITLSTPQSINTTASVQFGSFGVGTAASGTTGEIRATNNVTAFYSDARLKDFKGTIPNALAKVQALNGYYFTENEVAKTLGYNNDQMQVGVSAQEVEAVLPEVVTDAPINANFEGADYKTVYYDKLVPLLIEAIKELKAEVDELKKDK